MLGDLNGDGKPDFVVSNAGSNTVQVLLNTMPSRTSTPSLATQQTFSTGTNPDSVAVRDVNGDGLPDLIVANKSSNTVSVLLNTTFAGASVPSFASQVTFATGTGPAAVVLGDVNGDGRPDLIVANSGSNTVSVLLNTTPAGAGVPSFATQVTFVTGTSPVSMVLGDVNGDGKPDLIVANEGSNTVSVLLNTTTPGAITPSFAAQQTFATGSNPDSVALGDINGDGQPDLVVANSGSNTVSVLLNTTTLGASTPSFASQQTFATGSNPAAVAVGDLNGDGKPDLAVANSGDGTVSVLFDTTTPGSSVASFTAQQVFAVGGSPVAVALWMSTKTASGTSWSPTRRATRSRCWSTPPQRARARPASRRSKPSPPAAAPMSLALGDLNGDGQPDLVVANSAGNTLSVLLNANVVPFIAASFGSQQTLATGSYPVLGALADLNADGKPDLVVANQTDNTVSVFLNTTAPGATSPNFASPQTFAAGSHSTYVGVGDVNGDGKPDLVISDYATNSVMVLLNTTAPGATTVSFAAAQTFASGVNPNWAVLGDVNGDGKLDIITANAGSNTVSVLLNTTAPGASVPSFASPQSFAVGAGPRTFVLGDINGDGKPDLVVANQSSNTISVLLNTTAPGASTVSFTTQQTYVTGTAPTIPALADINGDGKPDIVVANNTSGTVSVLLNTTAAGATTASFATPVTVATASNPTVAVGDINGDGQPDLVVSNTGSSTVSVLLNTTAPGAAFPASSPCRPLPPEASPIS